MELNQIGPARDALSALSEASRASLRIGRITAAAAIIYAESFAKGNKTKYDMWVTIEGAVTRAFDIDKEVQRRIEQEKP